MKVDLSRIARVFARDAERIEASILKCGSRIHPGEVEQLRLEAAALRTCCEKLPGLTADEALAAIDEVCRVCEGAK